MPTPITHTPPCYSHQERALVVRYLREHPEMSAAQLADAVDARLHYPSWWAACWDALRCILVVVDWLPVRPSQVLLDAQRVAQRQKFPGSGPFVHDIVSQSLRAVMERAITMGLLELDVQMCLRVADTDEARQLVHIACAQAAENELGDRP